MILRRFSPLVLTLQFVLDLALTLSALKVGEQLRLHITTGFEEREQFVAIQPGVYVLVLGVWALFFLLFGVYDHRRKVSLLADLANLWLALTVAILVLASLFYFLALKPENTPSRLFYGYFYATDLVLLSAAHVVAFQVFGFLRRRGRHVRRVVLIGGGVRGRHVAVRLRGRETAGVQLVGYVRAPDEEPVPGLSELGALTDVLAIVATENIEEVVMALPANQHALALRLTSELQERDVSVRISPDVFEMVAMRARIEDFYGLPLISLGEPSISPIQARVKRAFDLAIACILFVLAMPLMLAIALAIKLETRGPIIIHQRRVGARGIPFHMHKFRSMRWDPEGLNRAPPKLRHDDRVTKVGRIIRRTSLDELPNLWNVIRGEMSLVGPRPELPAIVESYEPWQLKRLLVPPGMTGWWQINGRADNSMHQNTEIDLYYVQNYSILLDLQILLRTLGAVIKGRGAY